VLFPTWLLGLLTEPNRRVSYESPAG
jgi:hypothetical protein